ncbi:MAG: hypothetical protein PUF08_08695, partial [Clostridiales bacterium]|nr:hypothetical protein [Clostridiales bacterium]
MHDYGFTWIFQNGNQYDRAFDGGRSSYCIADTATVVMALYDAEGRMIDCGVSESTALPIRTVSGSN